MRLRVRVVGFLLLAVFAVSLVQARVVRVEITSRTDIQEGKPFGNAGAYEKIIGRVYFAVDPGEPAQPADCGPGQSPAQRAW